MITVDMQALERELGRVNRNMGLYFDTLGMNVKKVLAWQSGLLQSDIAKRMLPGDKGRLERKIPADVKKVFAPMPEQVLPAARRGRGAMVWYESGPQFLLGTYNWDMGRENMASTYRKYLGTMGKKYRLLGKRGRQHVYRVERFVVRRTAFNAFIAGTKKKVGKLKASFCKGLSVLPVPTKPPAKWISDHIADSKGDFFNGLDSPEGPHVVIISRQPGCENPRAVAVVADCLRRRANNMVKHVAYLSKPAQAGKARQMEYLYGD